MNTDQLLAGPRGRRLCLNLAAELEPRIRMAVFNLGYELDPGKGVSVVRFGTATDAGGATDLPAASPEELGALLAAVDVPDLDEMPVLAALDAAVATARYWQAPDGEDVLAALPVIREALRPVADRVRASPGAGWWEQPRAREQWAVDWRDPDAPAPLGQDLRTVLAEWARNTRAEELRALESFRYASGSWWSIPVGLLGTIRALPVGLDLVEDAPGWREATAIPVRGDGRTYEIRTADDWAQLCRAFPLEVTASRRHDWFQVTGRDGRWVIPDWERVGTQWDAVHLTVLGYLACAGRALTVDSDTASVIAGWDPDRTIWLTDVVRETGGQRQSWHRSQPGDAWREQA
ncbi:hypothetical protein LJ754_07280 [Arthrobacter sp. zg-Y40]|uniref:hypothetical protein n=1 Tax=Arthrobacter sp. zg-Y40 TaxID=2886939 RepID=UPI001D134366|nr:hypothetical protein [Arthrobacter sp. zg-Y40]